MKKLVLSLMAAVAMALVPQTLAAVNSVQYLATYGNSLTVGTDTLGGVTYSTVRYGDLYNGGEPGMPSLPIDYIRFSVPYNATNFTVTASPSRWSTSNLSYLLYPCQMPWIPNDSIARPITLPDTAAYYSGVSYPSQMAWVADEGFLAGENHIVTVAVMPFRYTHSTTSDEVRKCRNLTVRLNYELSDSLTMYPIVRNDSALREEGYQLAQSMVVNPNQVKSFSFSYNLPGPTVPFDPISPNAGLGGDGMNFYGDPGELIYDPDIPANPDSPYNETNENYIRYPYLIITTPELYHAARRIAALKMQKGYNVKIVTFEQIMRDSVELGGDYVNGSITYTDNAGILRQFIRKYYNKYRTKYVLLAGEGIPYRSVDAYSLDGKHLPELPTDLYFSDLNGDWSEPISYRKIDVEPELFVGRLLATDNKQMLNYTNKLFRYELNPGNGDYSYLDRLFYSECLDMQFPEDGLEEEVEYVHRAYSQLFSDTTHMKESRTSTFPSGTDIINQINSTQYGYLSLFNHAGPSGFITNRYNNNDLYLWAIDSIHIIYDNSNYEDDTHTGNGINNMMNKWYPNICYTVGCTTMPFDRAPGYEGVVTNIGNSFTTGEDYGGPAFLGNTRIGNYPQESSKLEYYFGRRIIDGYYKIGEAEAFSRSQIVLRERYISMVHNLLGDPEFELWTDEPGIYSDVNITRKDSTITLLGNHIASTILAYYTRGKQPACQTISKDSVTFQASPNAPIMLYKHNMIPYIAPLLLQNEEITKSQYIIANDVYAGKSIDDNRTKGNVVIKSSTSYEIEAKGNVTLQGGFMVEKGAVFTVYPSSF